MAKYTFYIVTRSAEEHYPVLMANNGKIPFNESVKRATSLELSFLKFLHAADNSGVDVVYITHDDFKVKFPKFARNAGPKKKR